MTGCAIIILDRLVLLPIFGQFGLDLRVTAKAVLTIGRSRDQPFILSGVRRVTREAALLGLHRSVRIFHLGILLGVTRKTEGVATGQQKLWILRGMRIVAPSAFSFHVRRMHNGHATSQLTVFMAAEAKLRSLLIQGERF